LNPKLAFARTALSAYTNGVLLFSLFSPVSWNLVPDASGTDNERSGSGFHQDPFNDPNDPSNLPTMNFNVYNTDASGAP
jgi:hypothetical protein